MIFESKYRRQALVSWENEKQEQVNELNLYVKKKQEKTKYFFTHFIASFVIWLFDR
ncbi:hypothetical protein [Risungbinella massiliensis]|uniref:hypothetical protein n=1 Tax=Risungbinella massiliensis TaxID=1329796 RepID=UPI0012B5A796|nr:hypothetical protein [Risungbinella massiliensis]